MSKVTSVSGMFNFGTSNRIETLKTPYKNTLAIDITTGSTLYNQATGDVVTSVPANTSASLTYTNVNPRKTLPNDWKTQVNSSTYMTTTITPANLTSIKFVATVPSGYTKIGTLSTGLAVYANGNNLAFVDSKKILAPANSSYLFSSLGNLLNIDFSAFNTANVFDMSSMFYKCSSLTSLDVSGFDTSNVVRMGGMFSQCSALTSLDLSRFNTSNVINMSGMFSQCSALTSLDLSGFNTANVTDMYSMFYYCSALTSLDLSSFNMAKVTSYTNMLNFGSSSVLKLLKTPTKNTAALSITCANSLYATAGGTRYTSVPASTSTSLALRSANTISFNYNGGSGSESSRTVLYGLTIGTLPSASQSGYTFNGWYTSSSGGSRFYSSTVVTQSQVLYAHWTENTPTPDPDPPTPPTPPDPDPPTPGGGGDIEGAEYIIFTTRENVPSGLSKNNTFDYTRANGNTFFETGCTPTVYTNDSGTQVAFVGDYGELIAPQDCSNMFAGMMSLKWVIFRNYDTYDVTNMTSMFEDCGNLEFMEMLSIQTPNVTSMNSMFKECSLLRQIAFAEFDCISLEDASYMFYNCSSLGNPLYSELRTGERIGSIPNIKYTYNLANAEYMFAGCGWDTFVMPYMFTNNLSNTNGMFENTNFKILDLSQFIAKASDMEDIWGSGSCNVEAIYTPRYCNPDTFIGVSNYYLASGSDPDVFLGNDFTTVPFSLCFVRDDKINDYEQCTFHLTINGWSDDELARMIETLINSGVIFSGSRDNFSFSTYNPIGDAYYLLPMPIAEYDENGDEGNFAGWIRGDGSVDPNQPVDRFSDSDFFKRWGWMNSSIDSDVYLQSMAWSDTTAQCMGNTMGGTINIGGSTPYNDFYNNDRNVLSLVRYLPSVHYDDGSIFTGWYFENSGDKIDYYTNITIGIGDGIASGKKSADSYEQYFSFPSGSSNFKANKTASEKEMQEILKLYNESKQTILIPENKKVTITELKLKKVS